MSKYFCAVSKYLSFIDFLQAYFEQFSKVKESMLAYDKVTNRHRGFGFVTFDNEDVVDKICEIHFHEINGELPSCWEESVHVGIQ